MASIIAFIQAHLVIVVGLIVAIMDFVFALIPSIESNGIVHMIYLWLKKMLGSSPQA